MQQDDKRGVTVAFWSWLDIPVAAGVLASARAVPLWLDRKKALAGSSSAAAAPDLGSPGLEPDDLGPARLGPARLESAGLAESDERLAEPGWLAAELEDWVAQPLTPCPQCGLPAEIRERFWLQSTDGPVDHVAVSCIDGHHFRMAADRLVAEPVEASCARTSVPPSTW
jgi:hypothetical protein